MPLPASPDTSAAPAAAPQAAPTPAPAPPLTQPPSATPLSTTAPTPDAPGRPANFTETWQQMLADTPPTATPAGTLDGGQPAVVQAAPATEPPPILPADPAAPPAAAATPPDAPATAQDTSSDAEPPAIDETALLAKFAAEEQRRINAQRKIGEQGAELGALRQQVAHLTDLIESRATAPAQPGSQTAIPQTREELTAALLDRPDEILPAIVDQRAAAIARDMVNTILTERSAAWQAQQATDAAAIAPGVGTRLFLARNGIDAPDFQTWVTTTETGKAVDALFVREPRRRRLLEAYIEDADPQGIADVLTDAHTAHLGGKKSAETKRAAVAEIRRVESGKSAALPSAISPVLAQPPKSFDKLSYQDILAMGSDG